MRVEDIMSKDVAVTQPGTTLKVARLLVERRISRLLVVSAAGQVVVDVMSSPAVTVESFWTIPGEPSRSRGLLG
jgi:predicted transcriptional regulator